MMFTRLVFGLAIAAIPATLLAQEIDESVLPTFEEGLNLDGILTETEEIGTITILENYENEALGDIDREVVEEVNTASGAVLRGLDRVSTEFQDYTIENGGSAMVGPLLVELKECRYPNDNPSGEAYAYLTIEDRLVGEFVFEGWMMASAPALNALDHSRYDVWVLRCTIDAPEGTSETE